MRLAALFISGACALAALRVPATAGDEDCLACHGDRDARDDRGRSVYVDAHAHRSSAHASLSCTNCHKAKEDYPHPARASRASCEACHADVKVQVAKGTHAGLGQAACVGCHGAAHAVIPAARTEARCGSCHQDSVKEYQTSVHARFRATGDGATCSSCHGPAHGMLPATAPASSVSRGQLPHTCGSCHASPEFLAKHKIAVALPVEAYRLSVHGRAVAAGRPAASCSDCHGNHAIVPASAPTSKINHWNVVKTCGTCHQAIAAAFSDSVHGRAVIGGLTGAPVCTDCHGEHAILAPSEPGSLVHPARVSTVTCGRCHADERLAEKYNLPRDKVPAFEDSYHGLALRSGQQHVANCASCHGVHNILPSSDPRSTTHPASLARTCGNCHPGAGTRFSLGPVHVSAGTRTEHRFVRWVRWSYLAIIPVTLGLMLFHNGADFVRKLIRGGAERHHGLELPRMGRHFRIAHAFTLVSFPVLVVTGFALKFPEAWWAQPLLLWESELAFRGWIHRGAGVVLMIGLAYHGLHLVLSRGDRRVMRRIVPAWRDLTDAIRSVGFNLGWAPAPPRFGVFSYAEKAEYWAYLWGTAVMAVTGFALWFDDWTLRYFPKWMSDVATAIHYYEAILATAAIAVWHFYLVIFDPEVYPMERAWLTGRVESDRLRRERPSYYRALVRFISRPKTRK